MSNNSFKYSGKVIAKTSSDGTEIIYKNTGTPKLGTVICKALAGYSISKNIPKAIDVQYLNGDNWLSLLNRRIPVTGVTYSDFDELSEDKKMSELTLNSVILYEDIKSTGKVSESTELRFALYDSESNLLAQANSFEKGNEKSGIIKMFEEIGPGIDCIINWSMQFFTE